MRKSCGCRSHNGLLTAKGLEETAQQNSLEGLAPRGALEYVDMVGSVRGLRRDEDMYALVSDHSIEEQARRFHSGT